MTGEPSLTPGKHQSGGIGRKGRAGFHEQDREGTATGLGEPCLAEAGPQRPRRMSALSPYFWARLLSRATMASRQNPWLH